MPSQKIFRRDALKIFGAAINALKPANFINEKFWSSLSLPKFKKIYLIGAGKGVRFWAFQLEKILKKRISASFLNDIDDKIPTGSNLLIWKASHPLPDQNSLAGTEKILRLVLQSTESDLIICLFAGGASSLFTWPNLPLKQTKQLNDKLIKSGASIEEINTVRKHIDYVKGGWLAFFINPRPCISLLISDVPNDDLSTIASGPTVYDRSTIKEATKVLKKYHLFQEAGSFLVETPKDKEVFKKVQNILLVNNQKALKAMEEQAKKLGYQTKILDSQLEGNAEKIGKRLIKILLKEKIKGKLALIAGGETNVRVTSKGRGGRNTHLCLATLPFLSQSTALLAVDSDGQDNTEAAGALITERTIQRAKKLGLNPQKYLKQFNSYQFFQKTGDLIKTGPLPTNVGDLILVLRG